MNHAAAWAGIWTKAEIPDKGNKAWTLPRAVAPSLGAAGPPWQERASVWSLFWGFKSGIWGLLGSDSSPPHAPQNKFPMCFFFLKEWRPLVGPWGSATAGQHKLRREVSQAEGRVKEGYRKGGGEGACREGMTGRIFLVAGGRVQSVSLLWKAPRPASSAMCPRCSLQGQRSPGISAWWCQCHLPEGRWRLSSIPRRQDPAQGKPVPPAP